MSKQWIYVTVFACLSLFVSRSTAWANDVYIAQTAAGAASGADCADALAVTYFNNSGNWTSATPTGTKIGPGTTVHICGTITEEIFVGGSGASGNPITIQFDPTTGGTISVPTETDTQLIWLGGNNYLTFIGHSSEGTSPDCQATNNGTSPTYTYQNAFSCFNGNSSHDITISNFGCANLYVRTSTSDTTVPADVYGCYYAAPIGANVTIHDSTFHDFESGIQALEGSGTLNLQIYNNNFYNFNHFVDVGCSATMTGVYFHDNQIHNPVVWDNPGGAYHHDGLFLNGASNGNCSSIYDYNNWYYGDWGTSTSPIFVDINGSPSTLYSGMYVFNDVFQDSDTTLGWTNGINLIASGSVFVYNNTVVCAPGSSYLLGFGVSTAINFRNNVQTSCQMFFTTSNAGTATITAMDYNAYANLISSGTSAFYFLTSNSGSGSLATQFSNWKTIVQGVTSGSEAHSATASSADLNSYGAPQAGSFVIGAGVNLCNGIVSCTGNLAALASDTSLGNTRTPTARPTSGAWDVGAYNYSSGAPSPPTGLSATAH